jgi:mannose-6-phosphate isomerase-like protein (cupin superfamily)
MLSTRIIVILGVVIFLSYFPNLNAADTDLQVLTNLDEILKQYPLEPGVTKAKVTKIEGDCVTILVVQNPVGLELKPHYHNSHAETLYVVKGSGQIFSNDKWVDIKPGSIQYNPISKVNGIRNTGNEPLVFISIFYPALKDPDSHFVK